jgi:DNA-binding GntR family transcriptional regulator
MHNYLRLIRLDRKLTVPLVLRSIRERVAIINACEARDPDAAEAPLVAYVESSRDLRTNLGLGTHSMSLSRGINSIGQTSRMT